MDFENLLLGMNEAFHKKLAENRAALRGKDGLSSITASQLFYLEAVYRLGSPTITQLADHLGYSKASTTAAVQKLEKKKLVIKSASPDDGRSQTIRLSDIGQDVISLEIQALRLVSAEVERMLGPEEQGIVESVLERIISKFG